MRYGLTPEDCERMLAEQDGVCPICKRSGDTPKWWHVDHNHETGEVRGLLCSRCNRTIGAFEDRADLLLAAYNYLIKGTNKGAT